MSKGNILCDDAIANYITNPPIDDGYYIFNQALSDVKCNKKTLIGAPCLDTKGKAGKCAFKWLLNTNGLDVKDNWRLQAAKLHGFCLETSEFDSLNNPSYNEDTKGKPWLCAT